MRISWTYAKQHQIIYFKYVQFIELQLYLNKITTDKSEKDFLNVKINGNWHDLFYFPKCFTCYGSTHSMENDIHTLWVENNITNLLTNT